MSGGAAGAALVLPSRLLLPPPVHCCETHRRWRCCCHGPAEAEEACRPKVPGQGLTDGGHEPLPDAQRDVLVW